MTGPKVLNAQFRPIGVGPVTTRDEPQSALGNGSHMTAMDTVPFCLWVAAHWQGDSTGHRRIDSLHGGETEDQRNDRERSEGGWRGELRVLGTKVRNHRTDEVGDQTDRGSDPEGRDGEADQQTRSARDLGGGEWRQPTHRHAKPGERLDELWLPGELANARTSCGEGQQNGDDDGCYEHDSSPSE